MTEVVCFESQRAIVVGGIVRWPDQLHASKSSFISLAGSSCQHRVQPSRLECWKRSVRIFRMHLYHSMALTVHYIQEKEVDGSDYYLHGRTIWVAILYFDSS